MASLKQVSKKLLAFPNYLYGVSNVAAIKLCRKMANVIQVTVMRGPGTSANAPYPASYVALIGTNTISRVEAYTAAVQSGVNSIIRVRYNNNRSLIYKGTYYVNETVAALKTAINA